MKATDPFEVIMDELKAGGHRLTPQRVAIVRLLVNSRDHPSAAQLYERIAEQFPTTSLATVYKTLAILRELGLVHEMGFSEDDNRYDAAAAPPHAHLICVRCRKITDQEIERIADLALRVAERSGYRLTRQRMEFYGLCPECQRETTT
jgi:Fur family transcriptional regulator, peroxide stress response regulator